MHHQVPRRIVAVIIAITITGITTNTLIGPAIPELLDEFGAPDSAAGYLIAAGSAPGVLIAPLIGFLADRFGRREVIVPCLVGLLLGIVVFGLAEGLTIPALQDAAASAGDESQGGTLVATQVGMARLGQTTGPTLIAPVVAAWGYAASFVVAAVVAAGPLVATVSRHSRSDGRRTPTPQEVAS